MSRHRISAPSIRTFPLPKVLEAPAADHVAVLTLEHLSVPGEVGADGALHELLQVVQADTGPQAVWVVRHGFNHSKVWS